MKNKELKTKTISFLSVHVMNNKDQREIQIKVILGKILYLILV